MKRGSYTVQLESIPTNVSTDVARMDMSKIPFYLDVQNPTVKLGRIEQRPPTKERKTRLKKSSIRVLHICE